MSLSASDWLTLRPGANAWLDILAGRGYALGSDLVEGPYLRGDADGAITAEKILLALDSEGLIRRGEERPSLSQLAFDSLGNMARKRGKGLETPATWFAWHPHKDWHVLSQGVGARSRAPDCVFCSTGKCWSHP